MGQAEGAGIKGRAEGANIMGLVDGPEIPAVEDEVMEATGLVMVEVAGAFLTGGDSRTGSSGR